MSDGQHYGDYFHVKWQPSGQRGWFGRSFHTLSAAVSWVSRMQDNVKWEISNNTGYYTTWNNGE